MFPTHSMNNSIYSKDINIKDFGKHWRTQPVFTSNSVCFTNNSHLQLIEFVCGIIFACLLCTVSIFIGIVFFWGFPRKITNGINKSSHFAMTTLLSLRSWRYKCLQYQSAHFSLIRFAIFLKPNHIIGAFVLAVKMLLQFSRNFWRFTKPFQWAHRINLAIIRSKITGEVRNRFKHKSSNKNASFISGLIKHLRCLTENPEAITINCLGGI